MSRCAMFVSDRQGAILYRTAQHSVVSDAGVVVTTEVLLGGGDSAT
jgi:hypothetical protein